LTGDLKPLLRREVLHEQSQIHRIRRAPGPP
jgi:hypothetical protein